MEAISLVSGALSIVSRAAQLSISLSRLTSSQKESQGIDTLNVEIHVYTKILQEVSQIALSGTSKLPESATLSLQLCNIHLSEIEAKLKHVFTPPRLLKMVSYQKMIEASVKDYRRSVKTLRAIVME